MAAFLKKVTTVRRFFGTKWTTDDNFQNFSEAKKVSRWRRRSSPASSSSSSPPSRRWHRDSCWQLRQQRQQRRQTDCLAKVSNKNALCLTKKSTSALAFLAAWKVSPDSSRCDRSKVFLVRAKKSFAKSSVMITMKYPTEGSKVGKKSSWQACQHSVDRPFLTNGTIHQDLSSEGWHRTAYFCRSVTLVSSGCLPFLESGRKWWF